MWLGSRSAHNPHGTGCGERSRVTRTVFGSIGYWSELKLEILRKYAVAYSRILTAQPRLAHIYVDAFAGAGKHLSRTSGEMVAGSPLNALLVTPPFREYHLIDLDGDKVATLRGLVEDRANVYLYPGDCNDVLLRDIFPRLQWTDYRRAIVLLDPYGLHLDWQVIHTAGQLGTVDMFLNFPVADINRNVLWRNPENVDAGDVARMTRFWGDHSWRSVVYTTERNLFGWEEKTADNETVAAAFRDRLRTVARFGYVPDPLPMRNTRNVIVYYLFFASQKHTANRIVTDIFNGYRARQG
jgi:three-Cys-motif partner protein